MNRGHDSLVGAFYDEELTVLITTASRLGGRSEAMAALGMFRRSAPELTLLRLSSLAVAAGFRR